MLRFIGVPTALLLLTINALAQSAACPPNLQPYANRCVSPQMADYISCVEASGGNKQELIDQVAKAKISAAGGTIQGAGRGPAIAASGALSLDKRAESELVARIEKRWFASGMSECRKAMETVLNNSPRKTKDTK